MHPLDLMKTRYQAGLLSGGVARSFTSILRREGMAGLYKGYVPVVSVVSPRVALQFTGLQFFKTNFVAVLPAWFLPIGAGIATGILQATLLLTPFEVVKVRQQMEESVEPSKRRYKGSEPCSVFSSTRKAV